MNLTANLMTAYNCVIVIPVHKPEPTYYELISFEQAYRIFHKFPIYIVAPEGLNLQAYHEIIPAINVKYLPAGCQNSLLNYNKLKLSQYFYKLFASYKYLMTYELDAFAFKNDLQLWCNKGYDYIGAPWFEGFAECVSDNLMGVGNSGFSLRSVAAMQKGIKTAEYNDPTKPPNYYKNKWLKLRFLLGALLPIENIYLQDADLLNEDWVIAELIARRTPGFKLAPIKEAMQFSFEVKPEALFELNNHQLPTGCHAWWRYNLPFWKPFIEKFGYKL
jgi:hypothetical protein